MWKPMYNIVVAFPTAIAEATLARKALGWGSMHPIGKPVLADIDGREYEIRTYQFAAESLRKQFKERVAQALAGVSIQIELEDEVGRIWVPDR